MTYRLYVVGDVDKQQVLTFLKGCHSYVTECAGKADCLYLRAEECTVAYLCYHVFLVVVRDMGMDINVLSVCQRVESLNPASCAVVRNNLI